MSKFKYREDTFLKDVLNYISQTYGEHYAHEVDDKGMQVFDLWEGLGSLDTTARDTAIKYLTRYGRKDGYNRKDLLKAIHYICILAYATENKIDADTRRVDYREHFENVEAGMTDATRHATTAVYPRTNVRWVGGDTTE